MAGRGRPRLTWAQYQERLLSYCRRHGVDPTAAGIPPFPSGRRETDQHREWLGLYKAHARLSGSPDLGVSGARSPDGACGLCGGPVEAPEAVAHPTAVLQPRCHEVASLVEALGPAGLDRVRAYLWPDRSNSSPRRHRKPGRTSSG